MSPVASFLMGAVAMASFVATLFFLRHWRQTHDTFFLLFAMSFALDALTRALLVFWHAASDSEPLVYLARLVTFGLIILAIAQKNWSRGRDR